MADLDVIQPRPDLADTTVFAPGIRVDAGTDIVFLSGISAFPLYPDAEENQNFEMPSDIGEQKRLAAENLQLILDDLGVGWRNIVKMVQFYTEPGGGQAIRDRLDGWTPCSSNIGVSALPIPGAKIVFDVTVVI